jgi:hypothetical protein
VLVSEVLLFLETVDVSFLKGKKKKKEKKDLKDLKRRREREKEAREAQTTKRPSTFKTKQKKTN